MAETPAICQPAMAWLAWRTRDGPGSRLRAVVLWLAIAIVRAGASGQ